MCHVGKYNCSHECLTSSSVLSELVQLPKTNPQLHVELSKSSGEMLAPEEQEEELFEEYKDGDDSAVTVKALVKHITTLVSPAATSSTH